MTFTQAIGTCFAKTFVWRGRAARSELWWFVLLCACLSAAALPLAVHTLRPYPATATLCFLLLTLAPLPTALAAWARRMHDRNRRAGWVALLIPPPLLSLLYALSVLQGENLVVPWNAALALPAHLIIACALATSAALALIPVVSAMLPGTPGANRYGSAKDRVLRHGAPPVL